MTRELAGKLLLFGLSLKTDARCGRAPSGSQGAGPTLPDELLVSLAGSIAMALHRRIEAFNQCPSVERLTQEAGCSGFQCLRPACKWPTPSAVGFDGRPADRQRHTIPLGRMRKKALKLCVI
jgi:hypothetical protein